MTCLRKGTAFALNIPHRAPQKPKPMHLDGQIYLALSPNYSTFSEVGHPEYQDDILRRDIISFWGGGAGSRMSHTADGGQC